MKTMLLAVASMTLGTVLGFLVCGATARRLRRTTHGQRTAQKARDAPPRKWASWTRCWCWRV